MNIDIQQVGKRWFLSWGYLDKGRKELFNVEASYSHRTEYVKDDTKSKAAGYDVWGFHQYRKWKLTGKGSEKYREEINSALDAFVDALELPQAIESSAIAQPQAESE